MPFLIVTVILFSDQIPVKNGKLQHNHKLKPLFPTVGLLAFTLCAWYLGKNSHDSMCSILFSAP